MNYDIIIIGAGASGLMAGITAATRGKSVLIIDHAKKIGQKILVSGGGRCNFTNIDINKAHYKCANPNFVKEAISNFKPEEAIEFFSKNGIEWEEREDGKIFGRHSARLILLMFSKLLKETVVKVLTCGEIKKIEKKEVFAVLTNLGTFSSPSLVVATGGLSYKMIGASGFGYEIAKRFGHKVVPAQPALVGLLFQSPDQKRFKALAGVSLNARVEVASGRIFKGGILFTHKGLSGPAILNSSLYWKKGEPLKISFLPPVPRRVVALGNALDIFPASRDSFDRAEVTIGGVDTTDISSASMGSKLVKGLYFTGEVLDVTGELGGYNLHWAWASGVTAGRNA